MARGLSPNGVSMKHSLNSSMPSACVHVGGCVLCEDVMIRVSLDWSHCEISLRDIHLGLMLHHPNQ